MSTNDVATETQSFGRGSVVAVWRKFAAMDIFFPLVGLIAVCVLMSFATDNFLSFNNAMNVLRQVSIIGIMAVGMTFVILTGGIDLSVGAVMALGGTITAGLMVGGLNPTLALLVGVAMGLGFGLFNGTLVAFAGMPSIIVTLATMGIARGFALIYSGGYPISGLPGWISWFGAGHIGDIPVPVVIMFLVYFAAWVALERTPFGRYVYAIGGNEQATRLSGVRVSWIKLAVYGIAGVTTAISAIVLTGRLMSGQPNAGIGFELDAIAAVVLGGTAITGGRGSILGTLIGAMLLGIMNNGLNLMGVDPYVQNVIKGAIILLAIYVGRDRRI
jgi:ribose transport system permease protein